MPSKWVHWLEYDNIRHSIDRRDKQLEELRKYLRNYPEAKAEGYVKTTGDMFAKIVRLECSQPYDDLDLDCNSMFAKSLRRYTHKPSNIKYSEKLTREIYEGIKPEQTEINNSGRSMDELHETCDKACEILKKTNDGDLLDPQDLKITEHAVNGYLNESGREVFEDLYRRVVIDGTYVKPFLHNIKHLTRDHEGYIYYKGIHVEHYDSDYVYSEDAKNSLLELKRRCEFLERKGVELSSVNVIWGWDNHADEYGAERLKELDSHLKNCSLQYSRVEIYNSGRDYKYFVCGTAPDLEEIRNHPVTQSMIGRYFDDEYEVTVRNFVYFNGKNVIAPGEIQNTAEVESLLAACHDYITKKELLHELPSSVYKTDFAEGYEKTKLLDSLIDRPDRSLQYSEVFMYGYGSDQKKLYIIGIPTADEVREYHEYQTMLESYGDRLNVSVTTYQYGDGEPLKPEEMPHIVAVAEQLYDTHYYLQKHDLSRETGWRDYVRDVEVNRAATYAEPEDEAEDGYEL